MAIPLKQGLKLPFTSRVFPQNLVDMAIPLKQGLKQRKRNNRKTD